MAICSRCETDHSSKEAIDFLVQESKYETIEGEDIHRMLLRGEDDGRRSSIAKFLRLVKVMDCMLKGPQGAQPPTPRTLWEVLLSEETF